MKRRALISLLGGAATWPLAARGQRAVPVIGFLDGASPETRREQLAGFHRGLGESGFVVGRDVGIEYRWANSQLGRIPELVSELVRRQVAVISTPGPNVSAVAAKAATKTIPIVFAVGEDPVTLGLVASLNRPGGNATGINYFTTSLTEKRLGLLRELVPGAAITVLANPKNTSSETPLRGAEATARILGLQINVLHASSISEIGAAFDTLAQSHAGALLVLADALFLSRRVQIATLATRYAIPRCIRIVSIPTSAG